MARPSVVVVGAGAFGGWTALHLARAGARVTLVDAWGAGHSRSSSGGETRVMRHTYGGERFHAELAARSLEQWRAAEADWGAGLLDLSGVVWMVGEDDAFEQAALPILADLGVGHEVWEPAELARRYPQIDVTGVSWVLYERDAGSLRAREACEAVRRAFVAAGGDWRVAAADPPIVDGDLEALALLGGERLAADAFVFACGPWLPALFGDVVGSLVRPTRQEVFFFGEPAGDTRFSAPRLLPWADHGSRFWYGIPSSDRRGFKVADDTRGPAFDPTHGDRTPSAEGARIAREYVERRFPGLRGAPLVEARVCQYSDTPDSAFLIDRHPRAANVWIAGGGAGHGFKHGPAVGEALARAVLEGSALPAEWRLGRFAQ